MYIYNILYYSIPRSDLADMVRELDAACPECLVKVYMFMLYMCVCICIFR